MASTVSAAVVLQDDFESYTTQASFQAAWPYVVDDPNNANDGTGLWSSVQNHTPGGAYSAYYQKTPKLRIGTRTNGARPFDIVVARG